MKTRAALKKICAHCFFVKRKGTVYVRCNDNAKHKQRQGFAQLAEGHEEAAHRHICVPGRVTPFQFQPANVSMWRQSASSQACRNQTLVGMMNAWRNYKKPF